MLITKRVEFDAGHRIPNHDSKCRHFHGHRYALEATLEGEILPVRGKTDDGMVMDFSALKRTMVATIVDVWDHSFLVYVKDYEAIKALRQVNSSHVLMEMVPTSENLAVIAFNTLDMELARIYEDAWGKTIWLKKVSR